MFCVTLLSAPSPDSNPLVQHQDIQNSLCPYCLVQELSRVLIVFTVSLTYILCFVCVCAHDMWNNNTGALHLTRDVLLQHYFEIICIGVWFCLCTLEGTGAGKLYGILVHSADIRLSPERVISTTTLGFCVGKNKILISKRQLLTYMQGRWSRMDSASGISCSCMGTNYLVFYLIIMNVA